MKEIQIKFRYVLISEHTARISFKWYTLRQVEEKGLGFLFDVENYEIISKDRYAGVEDTGGKQIWENSIVEYDNGTIAQVIFKDGGFCGYDGYASSSDEAHTRLCPDDDPIDGLEFEVKVIGNIHEHKHLLPQPTNTVT